MVLCDSSLHGDNVIKLGVGIKPTQCRCQLHGVIESMELTLAPGRRHRMGRITNQLAHDGGQRDDLEQVATGMLEQTLSDSNPSSQPT